MNYWHLTILIVVPIVGAAVMYGALRAVIWGAFRWQRSREALQKIGYPGPEVLLSRILMQVLWTVVGVIGLMLIGLLFQKLP
jgi:hypothetical protein